MEERPLAVYNTRIGRSSRRERDEVGLERRESGGHHFYSTYDQESGGTAWRLGVSQ